MLTDFSCGVKWRRSEDVDPVWHLSYVAYIYTLGFMLPVSIISTSYYKIIKTIKFKVKFSDNQEDLWF